MAHSYSDIIEGNITKEEYFQYYKSIKLKLYNTYIQHPKQWNENVYKIIFINDNIALGVSISGLRVGYYELFNVDTGFKYQDLARPEYRLIEIKD